MTTPAEVEDGLEDLAAEVKDLRAEVKALREEVAMLRSVSAVKIGGGLMRLANPVPLSPARGHWHYGDTATDPYRVDAREVEGLTPPVT